MRWPDRVVNRDEARRRFGDRLDRLVPWLLEADPLADAVVADLAELPDRGHAVIGRMLAGDLPTDAPDSVRALAAALVRVPMWVDWERIERAGRLLFRAGPLGGLVLGAGSLVAGYCAPAGNKPLVLTGALTGTRTAFRLAETGRFVVAVCEPSGLRRHGAGLAAATRVRLMHARVRWLVQRSGRWDEAAWGAPINQHDMVATHLLFSMRFVDGLRRLGLGIDEELCADWLHLWRLVSHRMGVVDDLLPTTEHEAQRLTDLIHLTQAPPDDDARRLVASLLSPQSGRPQRLPASVPHGLCRFLLGDTVGDQLGLVREPWMRGLSAVRGVVRPVDALVRRVRPLEERAMAWGRAHWETAIAEGAAGRPVAFRPTESLAG